MLSDSRSLVDTKRKYFDPQIGTPIQVKITASHNMAFESHYEDVDPRQPSYFTPSRGQGVLHPLNHLPIEETITQQHSSYYTGPNKAGVISQSGRRLASNQNGLIIQQAELIPGPHLQNGFTQLMAPGLQSSPRYNRSTEGLPRLVQPSLHQTHQVMQGLAYEEALRKGVSPSRQRHQQRLQRISQQSF